MISTDNADGQGNGYSTYALTMPTFSNGTIIPNGTYICGSRAQNLLALLRCIRCSPPSSIEDNG